MKVADVQPGFALRAAVLACVTFSGCTVAYHHECEEFPSIHGPCSWSHSIWQAAGLFAFSTIGTAVMMVTLLWVMGILSFRKRP